MGIVNVYTALMVVCVLAVSSVEAGSKVDVQLQLQTECGECHKLAPSDGPASLSELWQQKGPDLSFAGVKYKSDWMEVWLQSPTQIRPAGMFYGNHIQPGKERDEVKAETLPRHPKLSSEKARDYTAALMQNKAKQGLVKSGSFKPGHISLRMGEMTFIKFKGCGACHQIEPGYGGLSGPEVYTATKRLQEDYLMSFLEDPQQWSPKTFMPTVPLAERDRLKLVRYFQALSKEEFAQ